MTSSWVAFMRRYSGPLWAPLSEALVIAGLLQFLEKRALLAAGGVQLHLDAVQEVKELRRLQLPLHVEAAERVDLGLRGLAGRRARRLGLRRLGLGGRLV